MVTLTTLVTVPERVLFRDLAGEAVLLEIESGRYFGLNEIGTRIWHLLQPGRPLEAVYHSLLKEYEVPPDRLREDLCGFIDRLAGRGLLRIDE
ncbi:MAG TPA: PqqD family protein [Thermoanaerobaculia bacterium]|nr:PqqD family protein [Thermoanaerobaculia bacterium]